MMSKKRLWTREQKAAIEERGTLLVAAGAGSGKTAVLIERILAYVTDPQEVRHVDEFLVVTYTKAAAMEMKTRLREAIEQRLAEEEDLWLSEHLLTQLLLINQAHITTLHALGSDIVRQYFYVLEREPNFHVMDESQAQIFLREITEKLINEAYEACLEQPSDGTHFLKMAQFFSEGYQDKVLAETVLRVRQFAMSQPNPRMWLAGLAEPYTLEESEFIASPWGRALMEQSHSLLEEAACVLRKAMGQAQAPHGAWEYLPALEQDRQHVKTLKNLANEIDLHNTPNTPEPANTQEVLDALGLFQRALVQSVPPRLTPISKKNRSERDEAVLEKIKDEIKQCREIYKKNLGILKKVWIEPSLAEHLAAGRESGQIVQELADFAQRVMDVYDEEKRKRNCVDFADLEHLPLELFRTNPEVAESFRRQFQEVLVDEYQDISPVQEELLSLLSRPGHQFLVGDVKQSIYRFRMADPGLFNEKYTSFLAWKPVERPVERPVNGDSLTERVIDLRHNFRSRPRIIAAVNEVFGRLMNRETAEIEYDARAELIAAGFFGAANLSAGDMSEEDRFEADRPDGDRPDVDRPDVDRIDEGSSAFRVSAEGDPVEIHIAERLPKSADLAEWVHRHTDKHGDGLGGLGQTEPDKGDEAHEVNWDSLQLDMETARVEAHIVAQRIERLMEEGFPISQGAALRPVRYKDIAILMRSMVSARSIYREVFDAYGIPCGGGAGNSGAGGYEPVEMEIVMALLKVIDNPHQDIPLLAVLRSFLVGLTAEDLSRIRLVCPQGDFFEALCGALCGELCESLCEEAAGRLMEEEGEEKGEEKQPESWMRICAEVLRVFESEEREEISRRARELVDEEGGLRERLDGFCRSLMRWRVLAAREPLPEFIWRVYQETNILDYVGMMPEGKRRQENLLCFYEQAASFAQDRLCSVAAFLRYQEKAQEKAQGMGAAWGLAGQGSWSRQESQGRFSDAEELDQVHFLTVHGSKGLEFPVVFVVGLGSRFNRTSQRGKVLCHKDLGVGIAGADVARKVVFPSPVQGAVRWVLSREAVAEEMRVFYVALTRAKEKLILVGTGKDLGLSNTDLSSYNVRKASSCVEWMEMALKDRGTEVWRVIPYTAADILWRVLTEKGLSLKVGQHSPADKDKDKDKKDKDKNKNKDKDKDKERDPIKTASAEARGAGSEAEDPQSHMMWPYPHADQWVKVSVTRLKHLWESQAYLGGTLMEVDEEVYEEGHEEGHEKGDTAGVWDEDPRIDALALGRATHKVLQHIPWRLWRPQWRAWNEKQRREALEEHLHNLVERELIEGDAEQGIPLNNVAAFLSSPLGERIFAADEIYTEMPFILGMGFETEKQRMLVQGVTDLVAVYHGSCVENQGCSEGSSGPDRAIVVDFKTDRVRPGQEEVLTQRYALQMAIYARAVQNLMGVEVEETLIYAIRTNCSCVVGVKHMEEILFKAGLGTAME